MSWVVVGWALGFAGSASATNAKLEDAKAKLERLQYSSAAEELKQARQADGLSHDDLLQILELQGVTAAALGRSEEAEQFFRELVVLAPDFKLPKRWGPKIQTAFFGAKSWLDDQQPMSLSRQAPQQLDGKIVGVQLQLGPDPLQLVRRVRVHLMPEGANASVETRETRAPAAVTVAVAPGATVRWWAESLGVHGEVLQVLGSKDAPVTDHLEPPAPAPSAPPVPLAAGEPAPKPSGGLEPSSSVEKQAAGGEAPMRPLAYVLMGVGAAALVTGAVFATQVSSAHSKLDHPELDANGHVVGITQKDAQSLVDQSKSQAAIANICLISGGVLAAGGGAVYVYGMLNPSSPGSGGGVGVGGRW
ncbi:MAG: tetratricopeptide repeat protein [Deltaproteobacteria bacterium]|nr:tetratricopeptide repeat protein [Deltaproteobacteria bacterium]